MAPQEQLPDVFSSSVIPFLHKALQDLHEHPYPVVPSPPNVPRRASVALILRIQPHYSHWPQESARGSVLEESQFVSNEDKLNAFFAQDWVQHGDPEILFIKRAARQGDKWTGHIAFPGGRRDPEDADDRAAAIREAWEEVGIDLSDEKGYAINGGNLSQRVITSAWGATALMVFCPYIFLLTSPTPPLRLQPTEVASTHWVPFRALLNPKYRTYWSQDVSSRTARQDFGMMRRIHRLLTGQMLFAAIRLHPSESKFATEAEEYLSPMPEMTPLDSDNITVPLSFARARLGKVEDSGATLLLWGLTLGVVGDFLDMLPPRNLLPVWTYPTFTALDIRFILWAMSYRFRKLKQQEVDAGSSKNKIPAVALGADTVGVAGEFTPDEVDNSGVKRYSGRLIQDFGGSRSASIGTLLQGYYGIIRKAVILAVAGRATLASMVLYLAWKRLRK